MQITDQQPDRAVKNLQRVLDEEALLTPSLLRLTRWLADYYLCGWGQVLHAVVPAGVRQQAGMRPQVFITAKPADELPAPLPALTAKQKLVWEALQTANRSLTVEELGTLAGCGQMPIDGIVAKGLANRHSRANRSFCGRRTDHAPLPYERVSS